MYIHMARKFITAFSLMAALTALVGGGMATAAMAEVKPPHTRPDDSWITISGEIQTVDTNQFILDYGEGEVTVEMDDRDRDADAYPLLKGDKVRVTGKIDDDFFETTTIEAASVFVENLNTTFFASAEDEDHLEVLDVGYLPPIEVAQTTLRGTVTEVNDSDFTLDSGSRTIQVEIENLPYNPLDDDGYQKIRVGDRVRVVGQTDVDFMEGRVFDARSVVKMHKRDS